MLKKIMELKFLKAQRKMFIAGIKNLMTERSHTILRLTADNPLVDPKLIDRFVEYFH